MGGGGGVLWISVPWMIEWGQNQNSKKSLGLQTKHKKIHGDTQELSRIFRLS